MSLPAPQVTPTQRPRLEVAEIFRTYGPAYRQTHTLGPQQRKVMWAIENCRTQTLGGHLDLCTGCGDVQPAYNSCRNRHCPKCQSLAQAKWLAKRMERILPVHYFHVVFTLPQELRPLCRSNGRAIYNLLFDCASQTLLEFGRNNLGVQLGITAVLHTWRRDLLLHPHLHCVVTGGGLDPSGQSWKATSKRFLFPVTAMGQCFRGKFLQALRTQLQQGELVLDSGTRQLADIDARKKWLDNLYRKSWVVYCKPPFGGPEQVYAYLGRYTHRVAIANTRLVHVSDDAVRFRTRDGKHASLSPERFIGRFLLHVLPPGFVKIRHYGLMASSNATTRLEVARQRLAELAPEPQEQAAQQQAPVVAEPSIEAKPHDFRELLRELTGVDLTACRRCGGRRIRCALDDWETVYTVRQRLGRDTS
jgi:Putative transposase/Transposase zinc-binding domain